MLYRRWLWTNIKQYYNTMCSTHANLLFGKMIKINIFYKFIFFNNFIQLTTITNAFGTRYNQSCYDSNCNSTSYTIGSTNYVTKCCLSDNCNIYPQKKSLSCWVGGSYYGYITNSTKTECSEFDNEYCSVYKYSWVSLFG